MLFGCVCWKYIASEKLRRLKILEVSFEFQKKFLLFNFLEKLNQTTMNNAVKRYGLLRIYWNSRDHANHSNITARYTGKKPPCIKIPIPYLERKSQGPIRGLRICNISKQRFQFNRYNSARKNKSTGNLFLFQN